MVLEARECIIPKKVFTSVKVRVNYVFMSAVRTNLFTQARCGESAPI